jgi:hypothetical protein
MAVGSELSRAESSWERNSMANRMIDWGRKSSLITSGAGKRRPGEQPLMASDLSPVRGLSSLLSSSLIRWW